MVPQGERERLENLFKGASDAVNCLVCTPTLELGIDIGQLDSVLMRNVPPLPANYWQRAGRAGRRHRMAVDLTYCRSVSHGPSLLRGAAQVARGPDRSARLQPAERIDGRQARPRDDHRVPPPIRARCRAPGGGAGRDPGGARRLPAAAGGAVPLRRRRSADRAVRSPPASRPRAAQLRGPDRRRIAGVSAGLAGDGRRRDGARGAPRSCRGVCGQPGRRCRAPPPTPPLGAGSDPAPQPGGARARERSIPRTNRCSAAATAS